jgi:flagellin
MSSLLTNMSAMTALQSLAATQRNLQMTQNQISTGLKVGSAADNAAAWSTAASMKSDVGALGAVSTALSFSGSMLDTFTSALNQTVSAMNNIKNDLVSAQQPGADLAKIQSDIAGNQKQLASVSNSASFNGQNWLSNDVTAATGDGGSQSIISSYSHLKGVSFNTISTAATQLIDTSAGGGTATDTGILTKQGTNGGKLSVMTLDVTAAAGATTALQIADIGKMLTDVDTALKGVTAAAATIGAARSTVTAQSTFVSSLSDSLTAGVSSLVDADMNQASTRLQALQTQQQLGVQSLSIANQNTQMILKLFGG